MLFGLTGTQKMDNASLTILRRLERDGEVTLANISLLLRKKYGDHRDFYPLAALITQGFVEDAVLAADTMDKNPDYRNLKLQALSWKLFATSNADHKAEYKGHSWLIGGQGEKLKDQLYSLTGAGHLYLDEIRSNSNERRFTLLIAIFSAVFASALTYYLGKL
ncbi:hypothetical protein [Thiohalocapsa sp. ML1]|jgi:hypothetical protein|uniref:hypothetical protein n=1 Tax=Thiohalocapsa sp. ML1 TaxID=1431688 RepID=UPI0012E3D8E8|nr:hypothetical protein [Thiohalocapsa sp. ML1]